MSIQALTYVLEHCEATGTDRCLMFAIANHANEHGENCWASVATLAHEARCSERAAKYALKRLRGEEIDGQAAYDAPLIEAYGRSPSGTNFYRILALADRKNQLPLLANRGGADAAPPVQAMHRGGADSGKAGVQTSAPKPSLTAHEPTTTPPTPQRGERGKSRERERERLRADRRIWAIEHFPEYDPRAVASAMHWAGKRPGGAVTPDTVRAELERMPVEPIEAAAA